MTVPSLGWGHMCVALMDYTGAQGSWEFSVFEKQRNSSQDHRDRRMGRKRKKLQRSSNLSALPLPAPAQQGDSGMLSYGTFPKSREEGVPGPMPRAPEEMQCEPSQGGGGYFRPEGVISASHPAWILWTECLCPLRTHMWKL